MLWLIKFHKNKILSEILKMKNSNKLVVTALLFMASMAYASASNPVVPPSSNAGRDQALLFLSLGLSCVLLVLVIVLWRKNSALSERLEETEDDFQSEFRKIHEALPSEALTRDDVLLLINEENEKRDAMRGAVGDAKPLPAGGSGHDTSDEHPLVFYFGRPATELMFDDNRKTIEHFETSYYRFTVDKNERDQARIDFCPTRQGAIKALDGRAKTIEPVCHLVVKGDKPTTFHQTAPGRAVLKNGFWTVVKKLEVEYE